MYGLRDDRAIARELGRTLASVRHMAESLYSGPVRTGPWSQEEREQLKKYIGASTPEVIARILRRPERDVLEQLERLRRRQKTSRWTQAEISDMKRLYGTRTDEDLSLIFGRSVESVRRMAQKLCIAKDKAFLRKLSGGKKPTRMPRWTKDELKVLRDLYASHSNLEIAQKLDRSVKSVVSKAHNLGLKKDPSRLREMGRENVSLRYRRQ